MLHVWGRLRIQSDLARGREGLGGSPSQLVGLISLLSQSNNTSTCMCDLRYKSWAFYWAVMHCQLLALLNEAVEIPLPSH